ncbi:membrane protein [Candidatus Magnetoovum chiemensis]|nr:membrane protein [Candidatus Magnetoovum chiemensis]KJR43357.1 membrane protein [Candidatus Magnetoovum chiemensis]
MEERSVLKKIGFVLLKALIVGFMGGLVLMFLSLPIGVLFYVIGLKWLREVLGGGIYSLRHYFIFLQIICTIGGVVYFTRKDFFLLNRKTDTTSK